MEKSHMAPASGPRPPFVLTYSLFILLVTFMGLIFRPYAAQAQDVTSKDVNEMGYTVVVPNTLLMTGQTVDAEIRIGSAANPVRGAVGFDIWVELSDYGALVPSLDPDMQGSWIAAAGGPIEWRTGYAGTRYLYHFQRGTPVDGSGMVIKLRLKAAKDNVNACSIISNSGGLIQIDNLELRMAAPGNTATPQDAISVWPNPAAASAPVHVTVGDAPASAISLWNLAGQRIAELDPQTALDLSNQAAGTYLLRITDAQGQTHTEKLILR